MTRIHYTPDYLINPQNPITVNLIGAGGTGSRLITLLAQLNQALLGLNHPGIQVTVWDDDTVSEANLGRQLFAPSELGRKKGVALVERANRFFGTYWQATGCRFGQDGPLPLHLSKNAEGANIYISAVDTVAARLQIAATIRAVASGNYRNGPEKGYYWLDYGNSHRSGQAILASVGPLKQPTSTQYQPVDTLPFVTDEYGEALTESETADTGPSCSMAEALKKQDLFINTTLADMGFNLLWTLLRYGKTEYRGVFVNLETLRVQPLSV